MVQMQMFKLFIKVTVKAYGAFMVASGTWEWKTCGGWRIPEFMFVRVRVYACVCIRVCMCFQDSTRSNTDGILHHLAFKFVLLFVDKSIVKHTK